MTRPTLPELQPYLPPPADLTRWTAGELPVPPKDLAPLSDAKLAEWCATMADRLRGGGLDNTCRLLKEAAERLGRDG